MLFIYLKRAALNTRGGRGIDWSTYSVSLNGISPGHNRVNLIENEREGDTCLFNLHQNPIKPRSLRYAKRETVDVILNNLSSRSLKIVHRDDRPNGSIVESRGTTIFICYFGPWEPSFSYGNRVNRISLFRFRCSCTWIDDEDKRRKIEIVLFYSYAWKNRRRTGDTSFLCTEEINTRNKYRAHEFLNSIFSETRRKNFVPRCFACFPTCRITLISNNELLFSREFRSSL